MLGAERATETAVRSAADSSVQYREFRPVERVPEAFRLSLTAGEIEAVCRRVSGGDVVPVSVVELGTGMYDNVHRAALAERDRPVVPRVAPAQERQFRGERRLMRNEHAGLPWPAPVAHLMPQVIAADWTVWGWTRRMRARGLAWPATAGRCWTRWPSPVF